MWQWFILSHMDFSTTALKGNDIAVKCKCLHVATVELKWIRCWQVSKGYVRVLTQVWYITWRNIFFYLFLRLAIHSQWHIILKWKLSWPILTCLKICQTTYSKLSICFVKKFKRIKMFHTNVWLFLKFNKNCISILNMECHHKVHSTAFIPT